MPAPAPLRLASLTDRPVGLIAGGGRLPVLTARGLRAAGHRVAAVSLGGPASAELRAECDRCVPVGVLRIGEWARTLRRMGAVDAVMVGGVDKARLMYQPFWRRLLVMRPDWRVARLWYRVLRHDRRSQTLLTAVTHELARAGVRLMDSTQYIPEHLAHAGTMTRRGPTDAQRADRAFGWPVLLEMNRLEIGQSVAVRERDVIAVEAVEGTDAMIRRAGELARGGGWTLLKGAGATKDLRFDVPTVGVRTIENLRYAGAGAVFLDAGRVILIDKPEVIAAADAAGIALVGVDADNGPGGGGGNGRDARPR